MMSIHEDAGSNGRERPRGLWQTARYMAEHTPTERNRYVDFLRALAICAVVFGHWLVAAPWIRDGVLVGENLLGVAPWTQWLSWAFQVMPVFFLVGGYANGLSWEAVLERGKRRSAWLASRVQRLVNPVLPLFLTWVAFLVGGRAFGVDPDVMHVASSLALVPVWFLAVYLLVVAAVPLSWAAWRRWGMRSFWALAAGVAIVDTLNLGFGVGWIAPLNFLFVWIGIHQLGYAWRAGHFSDPRRALLWSAGGLATLCALVAFGPYPVAMIGVPGDAVSNSMPPKLALFALGIFQSGLVLALEGPARRLLANTRRWAAVILVNGMIMSLYLWHLTASIAVIGGAWGLGVGLEAAPGTGEWWLSRPLWLSLFVLATLPFVALFNRFERDVMTRTDGMSAWRLVTGIALVCGGLSLTAIAGIGTESFTGVRLWVVALPILGAALVDFGPLADRRKQALGADA